MDTPRRAVRWTLSFVAAATALPEPDGARAAPQNPARPNIVFFLIDDMGWTDVGCFGSRYYETPNIDRLCRAGMKFTSAYTNGPNCAPTRACLMSGRYPPRHGIYTVGSGTRGKPTFRKLVAVENRTTLPLAEVTVAEALQGAGYVTAHFGKWHLGAPPQAGPKQQGFDVNVGGTAAGAPRSYFSPYRNRRLADGPDGEYLTDRLTDEALAFVDANRDRPFFLYLAHYAVHTPIQAKEDITARYKQKTPQGGHDNARYAAMIESVDQSVQRVLARLDALELTERTVVIFTSDNGGVGGYVREKLGTRDITDNAPLRGGKGMLYEGGIRVPLMVRWPGVTTPGTVCDEPVISLDFYPTLLEIVGAKRDAGHALDGESLVPLLRSDGSAKLRREAIYWHFPGYLQANVRRGTWRTTPAGAIRWSHYKLIEFFETGRVELYDLGADVGERNDLAAQQPTQTRLLRRALRDWRRRVAAPMPRH